MSDHQPDTPELEANAAMAPSHDEGIVSRRAAIDPLELDFSRLRMARDKLDNAFRAR